MRKDATERVETVKDTVRRDVSRSSRAQHRAVYARHGVPSGNTGRGQKSKSAHTQAGCPGSPAVSWRLHVHRYL